MATLRARLLTGLLLAPAALVVAPQAALAQAGDLKGSIELMARAYSKRPPLGDRAKFEEYGELPPGLFISGLDLSARLNPHTSLDFSAFNVGLNNQAYHLRAADLGRLYLNLDYAQTPHLFSTQALTLFGPVGPSSLRIPDATRAALAGAANNTQRAAIIEADLHPQEIEVQRSRSQVNLRWIPRPAWDVRLDYSYEEREGSAPFGAPLNGFNAIELPAPVSTVTQNFSASVQYAGRFSERRRWMVALAYSGSIFDDNIGSITFDNPFRLAPPNGNNGSANEGRVSTAPSNEAHRLTFTGSADLPFSARYVGTASIARMTQNDPFIPYTINASIPGANAVNDLPATTPLADPRVLPASSLQGRIDEVLINNQLTMRLDPKWSLTARARYLEVDNHTPLLRFPAYVLADGTRQNEDRQNLRPAYKRENASLDLGWRPRPGWSLGATGRWENYDRDNRDVDVTNEYTGKLFVDARPRSLPWQGRASLTASARRYETYDNAGNVGAIAIPTGSAVIPNPLMRKFDMANRDRIQVDGSLDFVVRNRFGFSPSASWRSIDYGDEDPHGGDLGLKGEAYWSVGGVLALPVNPRVKVDLSYMHERYARTLINRQRLGGQVCPATPIGAEGCNWGSGVRDNVDTLEASSVFTLRPSRLTLNIAAVYASAQSTTATYALGAAQITSDPQFPAVENRFTRIDAKLDYVVSPRMTVQFAYALERNRMTNWQIDGLQPYMVAIDAAASRSLFLDAFNPNYTAGVFTTRLTARF